MGKLLKGKFLLLGTALLLFGVCQAENKETTKLDETFAHFLDEQQNLVNEETKTEIDAANIVSSEEGIMKKDVASTEQKAASVKADPAASTMNVRCEKKPEMKCEKKEEKKPVPKCEKKQERKQEQKCEKRMEPEKKPVPKCEKKQERKCECPCKK